MLIALIKLIFAIGDATKTVHFLESPPFWSPSYVTSAPEPESISIHPGFIFVNTAFVKLADDQLIALACVLKSYDVKFAPLKSTHGPCKYPPTTLNLGGSVGCDVESTEIPPDRTFVSVDPVNLTPVSTVFERSTPVKFVNDISTFAPIR